MIIHIDQSIKAGTSVKFIPLLHENSFLGEGKGPLWILHYLKQSWEKQNIQSEASHMILTTLLTVRLLKSRVRKQRSRKHGINLSSRPLFTVCFTSSPAQPERVAFYGLCFFCWQWCGFHFSPSSWLRSTTATRSRQKSVWNTTPCRLFQRWLSATSTCSKGLWLERQRMKKFCPNFMHPLLKKWTCPMSMIALT